MKIERTNLNIVVTTDSSAIRGLCIKNDWYTSGTIQDYNTLLTYCDEQHILTEERLNWIAKDIYDHSNNFDYSYTEHEIINNIICYILNDAVRISHLG